MRDRSSIWRRITVPARPCGSIITDNCGWLTPRPTRGSPLSLVFLYSSTADRATNGREQYDSRMSAGKGRTKTGDQRSTSPASRSAENSTKASPRVESGQRTMSDKDTAAFSSFFFFFFLAILKIPFGRSRFVRGKKWATFDRRTWVSWFLIGRYI